MARRVAIARAYAIRPDLMLLDEPFVSLDPAMVERSRTILLGVWQARPVAVLLVTHDLEEAASLADRIIQLSANPMRVMADIAVPVHARRAGSDAAEAFARAMRNDYFKVAR
jgi:NitT/TauT family transport system ATP-binding protein